MKYIPANTAFMAAGCFALQPKTANEEVTLSMSVDGVTYTALEDTFSGTQVFKDGPFDVWLKCDKDVYCSMGTISMVPITGTVTASSTTHGVITISDYVSKKVLVWASSDAGLVTASYTGEIGSKVIIKYTPHDFNDQFLAWDKVVGGTTTATFDENPLVVEIGANDAYVTEVKTSHSAETLYLVEFQPDRDVAGSVDTIQYRGTIGTSVTVTATAKEGYTFRDWFYHSAGTGYHGEVVSTDNPLTYTLSREPFGDEESIIIDARFTP